MKFENTEVWGFEHALRGMRNPLESWEKSDSRNKCVCSDDGQLYDEPCGYDACCHGCNFEHKFVIGENDLKLAQSLIKAGSEHRKFLRQIFVSVDITAPLYWWKEFDTYKVGTVSNSTSTMHKLASTPITIDCFEMDDFENMSPRMFKCKDEYGDTYEENNLCNFISLDLFWCYLIDVLNDYRVHYNETKDKRYWKELIRLLPESWLQKRTITMNYENILNMYRQRKHHKLTEWSKSFIEWVKTLPYAEELICIEQEK